MMSMPKALSAIRPAIITTSSLRPGTGRLAPGRMPEDGMAEGSVSAMGPPFLSGAVWGEKPSYLGQALPLA